VSAVRPIKPSLPAGAPGVLLALAAALGAWFVLTRAARFVHFDAATYREHYWSLRGALVPHMLGGTVALVAGLVQFWLGLTGRLGALHRVLGRCYLAGVAVGSAGALYMVAHGDREDLAYWAGLAGLAAAWLVTTATAYLAIRSGAVEQHRDWMVRSYVVTFAFVTFRLVDDLATGPFGVEPTSQYNGVVAWACWSVPLLLAEPVLQWRRIRRR
jgi:uncharacterized membrane protein